MSHESHEREHTGEGSELPEIEDGRYLYCAVLLEDDADSPEIDASGIDGEDVSVAAVGDVGIVYHACDGLYDSGDLTQIKRWLVRHQSVVDAAGEAFGTPLPFQFDTILRGGDERLREWFRAERESVTQALEELENHWEYRIEVVQIDPIDDEQLLERDDRLSGLRERIDDSESGTAHLLEKQYEQRLSELRSNRRERIEADLHDRLTEHAREAHGLERTPDVSLEGSDAASGSSETGLEAGETVCRFTVLADEAAESDIGSVLDDVAENPDLAVRFTGPWPPYTFAPELGESS